eukprot:1863200-Prymnesium_polylepis.1
MHRTSLNGVAPQARVSTRRACALHPTRVLPARVGHRRVSTPSPRSSTRAASPTSSSRRATCSTRCSARTCSPTRT